MYIATMDVMRVRVGVMEYMYLLLFFLFLGPTDDERYSVAIYHGCDTRAD
jgi:hypothetical protein